jgi:carboxyl-terminal processing protease
LNSKTKYAILLISSVLVVYAVIGGMVGPTSAQGPYQQLSIFMEVLQRIQNDYVDDPTMADAFEGAIRGMVERVDPYGGYLDPEVLAFYQDFDPQKTAGIGVRLTKKFDYPMIVSTVPGGPAAEEGFGTGDTLEAIDGVSLREHNLVEVNRLLAGTAGSEVSLSIIRRRQPAPEIVTLERAVVQAPPVEARMLEKGVAYLKIPVLAPGKALEAKRNLSTLTAQGATHIVLDLRNSAGGAPQEAIELANLFIESGILGYLEGQTVPKETFTAKASAAVTELPLAVLIDQGTADAAEIAAGAIGGNSRGELVGLKTFGIGSIQKLLPIDDTFTLLLSVAKYYTPDGVEIQENGITPTVEVTATVLDPLAVPDEEDQQKDQQLDRAIEVLLNPEAAADKAA